MKKEQKEKPEEVVIKKPLGLKPRFIWIEERVDAIAQAIDRYWNEDIPIPPEWKDELDDLTRINSNDPKTLFPDLSIDKKKKTLYRNCDLKKDGVLDQVFKDEIGAGIDVGYYATKVERWSNKKEGIKRGFYGWRDTIADFMDGDRKAKKLQMIETSPKEESEFQKRYRQKVEGMK